jgi:hypothetical protein
VSIPDYISPIVGCRVWQWDTTGLKSLCGEPWHPGQPLAARCRVYSAMTIVGRAEAAHGAHDAPQANCTCGVYATKSLEHLRTTGYARYGIHGEVNLWGTLVEHELGYRAQFAYPKNFALPPDTLPFTLAEMQSRLQMLTAYRVDIFVADLKKNIPLWANSSGYDDAGLGYFIERSKRYYDRRRQERTLKKGDRVAILGRGIAVVEQVDGTQVHVVLWNRSMLRIGDKEIVWDEVDDGCLGTSATYFGIRVSQPEAQRPNRKRSHRSPDRPTPSAFGRQR